MVMEKRLTFKLSGLHARPKGGHQRDTRPSKANSFRWRFSLLDSGNAYQLSHQLSNAAQNSWQDHQHCQKAQQLPRHLQKASQYIQKQAAKLQQEAAKYLNGLLASSWFQVI